MTKPAHIRAAALRDLHRQVAAQMPTLSPLGIIKEMDRRGAAITEDERYVLWETFWAPSETERCA